MKKETNKICERCNLEIRKDERAVQLRTFINTKTIEEHFWHLNCWTTFLEEKSMERAKGMFGSAMKQSLGMVKNIMGNQGKIN